MRTHNKLRGIAAIPASLSVLIMALGPASAVTLGISQDNRYFTINGKPTYLHGISYYGALSINKPEWLRQDLDDMRADGFNWIRVFATLDYRDIGSSGDYRDKDVSAIGKDGKLREPYMARLKEVIRQCEKRGMIVDCTMYRSYMGSQENQRIDQLNQRFDTVIQMLLDLSKQMLELSKQKN